MGKKSSDTSYDRREIFISHMAFIVDALSQGKRGLAIYKELKKKEGFTLSQATFYRYLSEIESLLKDIEEIKREQQKSGKFGS